MITIVLPLWGWVLIALAALIFLAYIERDRVGGSLGTVGQSLRRERPTYRRGGWDGAIVRRKPHLRKFFLPLIQCAKTFPVLLWSILTAPWRSLCAFVARRRLRGISTGLPATPTVGHPTDYSAKRARALAHLGNDYLLAEPVKRRRHA
jgi:hypothetical protein